MKEDNSKKERVATSQITEGLTRKREDGWYGRDDDTFSSSITKKHRHEEKGDEEGEEEGEEGGECDRH